MAGFPIFFWAMVLLVMLPVQAFAYCDVSFPTVIETGVAFETSWISGCPPPYNLAVMEFGGVALQSWSGSDLSHSLYMTILRVSEWFGYTVYPAYHYSTLSDPSAGDVYLRWSDGTGFFLTSHVFTVALGPSGSSSTTSQSSTTLSTTTTTHSSPTGGSTTSSSSQKSSSVVLQAQTTSTSSHSSSSRSSSATLSSSSTAPSTSPTSKKGSQTPIGAIVGGGIGGVLAIAAIVFVGMYCWNSMSQSGGKRDSNIQRELEGQGGTKVSKIQRESEGQGLGGTRMSRVQRESEGQGLGGTRVSRVQREPEGQGWDGTLVSRIQREPGWQGGMVDIGRHIHN